MTAVKDGLVDGARDSPVRIINTLASLTCQMILHGQSSLSTKGLPGENHGLDCSSSIVCIDKLQDDIPTSAENNIT